MKQIEYEVDVGSGIGNGYIYVEDNATKEEIMIEIIKDLYNVTWKKV